jgi:hypothetical protein
MPPYRRLNERISRYSETQVVTQLSHAAALLGGMLSTHADTLLPAYADTLTR